MKRFVVLVMAGALLLAGCGSDSGDEAVDDDIPAPGASQTTVGHAHGGGTVDCSPSGTALRITATAGAFSTDCLAAPANQPFTIQFTNNDTRAHNVAIFPSHEAVDRPLFRGELIPGGQSTTYNVPALQAGSYAFHTDTNAQQMLGNFNVK